ncbi:hypothetical protein CEE45_11930 [Candidatus Heimdallarchaeota archaeon B3_Heim]|nr:MAG: hypothetical protein CEE45_11930 [Candidatus Heimdallarchaeota archaeon B3_Heim]
MKFTKTKVIILIFTVFLSAGFIGTSALGGTNSVTQSATGFIAPKVLTNVSLNDGLISEFWVNITSYQNISEYGEGGFVKFANNATHLYSLLVFPKDSDWVSVEFEPDPEACMTNLNDGWSFYTSESPDSVEAKDVKFIGIRKPEDDTQKNLAIESVFVDNLAYVELVRPFDTEDADGFDITYSNGSLNMLQFASKASHFGAHTDYYLLITDSIIGEVPLDPIVDIPVGANLGQIKFLLLGVTPAGVFVFIIFHAIRRVFTSPIQHGYERVVGNSYKPPTFMERWRETFTSED